MNLHYGQDPGVKSYTHLSDQFGPYHTKVITATAKRSAPCSCTAKYTQRSSVYNPPNY